MVNVSGYAAENRILLMYRTKNGALLPPSDIDERISAATEARSARVVQCAALASARRRGMAWHGGCCRTTCHRGRRSISRRSAGSRRAASRHWSVTCGAFIACDLQQRLHTLPMRLRSSQNPMGWRCHYVSGFPAASKKCLRSKTRHISGQFSDY
jgi:hypothetical protein